MSVIHITANSRLSQFLKQQLTPFQQGVGLTPQVQTLGQWWQAWQAEALLMGELPLAAFPKQILSAFEAQLVWMDLLTQASQSQAELSLLNPVDTAKQAHQAWLFWQEYLQESDFEGKFLSAETRLWWQLKQAYQAYLHRHQLSDEALWQQQQFTWLAEGHGRVPQQFVLHGFEELSPYVQRWCQTVQNRGAQVHLQESDPRSSQAYVYAASSPAQEARQAAAWAVQQWQQLAQTQPLCELRIALVAPNLQDVIFELRSALDEQLVMAGLSEFAAEQPAYNVSLGQSLAEVPLVKNALQTLSLLLNPALPCRYNDWSTWLVSPYTHGDLLARHAVDAQLRTRQWASFLWPNLLDKAAQDFAPVTSLKKALEHWHALAKKTPHKMTLPEFVEQVQSCLTTLQWGQSGAGSSLDSVEYQQKQAFTDALEALKRLKTPKRQDSPSAWLTLLRQFMAEQVHQPQSTGVQPIQILGMLEASGQTFDALWVMGLTDQAWPRMPQPNVFIPFECQRDYKMPRADAQRELAYALKITQNFTQAAPQVVWSYAQQEEGALRLPSPLLNLETLNAQVFEPPQAYCGLAEQAFANKAAALWVEDAQAPPVPLGQRSPGGTGILAAQKSCPLMAFMDYRLGARQSLQTVEDGLQSTQLGSLIHKVLEELWQGLQYQSALLALSEQQLSARLTELMTTEMAQLAGHFDAHYLALEQQRILKLLLAWCALEKQRLPFKVLANELETEISLADILFKVKVDRIDEVNGELIILDYKTGKASVKGLISETFDAPQLAIYLFTLNALAQQLSATQTPPKKVAGLGYGILHSDDGVKFNVLVDQEASLLEQRTAGFSLQDFSKLTTKESNEFFGWDWSDFLQHLQDEVEKLALSVQQGDAAMVFQQESDLQYAASYLALRVPEAKAQLGWQAETEASE